MCLSYRSSSSCWQQILCRWLVRDFMLMIVTCELLQWSVNIAGLGTSKSNQNQNTGGPFFPIFHHYGETMTLSRMKCIWKLNFRIFFYDKNHFSPVSTICFWPHPQTAYLSTLRPWSFVAPVKTYTMARKSFENLQKFLRKWGKRFFWGANFCLNAGKAVEKKSCRIWEQEYYLLVSK